MTERTRAAGFTLVELLVVVAIVGLLVAMASVGYRHARIRSAETAAIGALGAINQAQFTFMQTCGNQRYAPTLVSLGKPMPGDDQPFISPDLSVSDPLEKSGYLFVLTGTPAVEGTQTCHGEVPLESYRLTADPVRPGLSGDRYFGTNKDRTLYADAVSFADNMPESGAPGHGAEIQ